MNVAESSETKSCPYCAELIKVHAIKCKHCGSMLNEGADSLQKHAASEETDAIRSPGAYAIDNPEILASNDSKLVGTNKQVRVVTLLAVFVVLAIVPFFGWAAAIVATIGMVAIAYAAILYKQSGQTKRMYLATVIGASLALYGFANIRLPKTDSPLIDQSQNAENTAEPEPQDVTPQAVSKEDFGFTLREFTDQFTKVMTMNHVPLKVLKPVSDGKAFSLKFSDGSLMVGGLKTPNKYVSGMLLVGRDQNFLLEVSSFIKMITRPDPDSLKHNTVFRKFVGPTGEVIPGELSYDGTHYKLTAGKNGVYKFLCNLSSKNEADSNGEPKSME